MYRVFDWDKAARLIVEHEPEIASAGLAEAWPWTGGSIYKNRSPILDDYTYLASNLAMPVLRCDGEEFECWISEDEAKKLGWSYDAKWPESALKILEGK